MIFIRSIDAQSVKDPQLRHETRESYLVVENEAKSDPPYRVNKLPWFAALSNELLGNATIFIAAPIDEIRPQFMQQFGPERCIQEEDGWCCFRFFDFEVLALGESPVAPFDRMWVGAAPLDQFVPDLRRIAACFWCPAMPPNCVELVEACWDGFFWCSYLLSPSPVPPTLEIDGVLFIDAPILLTEDDIVGHGVQGLQIAGLR